MAILLPLPLGVLGLQMWATMLGDGGFLAVLGLMLGIDSTQSYAWPECGILKFIPVENMKRDWESVSLFLCFDDGVPDVPGDLVCKHSSLLCFFFFCGFIFIADFFLSVPFAF